MARAASSELAWVASATSRMSRTSGTREPEGQQRGETHQWQEAAPDRGPQLREADPPTESGLADGVGQRAGEDQRREPDPEHQQQAEERALVDDRVGTEVGVPRSLGAEGGHEDRRDRREGQHDQRGGEDGARVAPDVLDRAVDDVAERHRPQRDDAGLVAGDQQDAVRAADDATTPCALAALRPRRPRRSPARSARRSGGIRRRPAGDRQVACRDRRETTGRKVCGRSPAGLLGRRARGRPEPAHGSPCRGSMSSTPANPHLCPPPPRRCPSREGTKRGRRPVTVLLPLAGFVGRDLGVRAGRASTGRDGAPATASWRATLSRCTGSRYRSSRRCALASLSGRPGRPSRAWYRFRAHTDAGRASRMAPMMRSSGTNSPSRPVQSLPFSRVIAARARSMDDHRDESQAEGHGALTLERR